MRAVVLLFLVIAFVSAPAISQPAGDKLIVPGERIGKWTLPVTIDGLLQTSGPKSVIGGGPVVFKLEDSDLVAAAWVHRWDQVGLRAVTLGSPDGQQVFNLTIGILFNPALGMEDYKTDKGVGLGVSRAIVEAAYGKPTAVTQADRDRSHLIYDELGFAAGLLPDGRVGSLIVFRSGTAKQRWRF